MAKNMGGKEKKETISSNKGYMLVIVGIIEDIFMVMIVLFSLVPFVGWFGGPALLLMFLAMFAMINWVIVLANGIKKIPPLMPSFTLMWLRTIAASKISDEVYNKRNGLS